MVSVGVRWVESGDAVDPVGVRWVESEVWWIESWAQGVKSEGTRGCLGVQEVESGDAVGY